MAAVLFRKDSVSSGCDFQRETGETNGSVMKACVGQMMTGSRERTAGDSSLCFIYGAGSICFCVGQM